MTTQSRPSLTDDRIMGPAFGASPPVAPIANALCAPRFLVFLVLVGIVLHVLAYASNTALWLDEILLSSNILALSLGDLLTRPLELDQVAPLGFLLVEKLAVLAMGKNELALRLFPFLCGLAAILLYKRLAERALDGLARPFAMALFVICIPVIKFGAEVKQYEVDATAAILLVLLGLDLETRETSMKRLVVIGLTGFVVIWFSQASVVVMGGIGAALAARWLIAREEHIRRALLTAIPMWAAAALVAIVVGLRSMSPSTKAFMDEFWAPGFFPLPVKSLGDLRWFWNQGISLFTDPVLLRYAWPPVFLVVSAAGLVALWRARRDVALLLMGPLVVALIAAIAHQYPFSRRLVFYQVPSLLLAIAAGAEWVRRVASRVHPALGTALMATLMVPPVTAVLQAPPPYELEHHRTLLAYLARHRRPGDIVYMMPLSRVGTLFYGPRYGLQPNEFVTAACDRYQTRTYLRDIDRFRGAPRLWVVWGGSPPFRVVRRSLQQYLSTIAVKRDSVSRPSLAYGSMALELFDLTDTMRLRAADAATFPAPPMPSDPRPGCRPWIRPSPLDSLLSGSWRAHPGR